MIRSAYVPGVQIPPFDSAINDVLTEIIDGGGNEMVTAIENLEGKIYRVVKTDGLGAYMNVVSELADLGLQDTLANSTSGRNGYDSWFIVTDEVINTLQAPMVETVDAVTEIPEIRVTIPVTCPTPTRAKPPRFLR